MMSFLLEDRCRREAEQLEDQRRWEEERERREVEHAQSVRQQQLEMMQAMMEISQLREEGLVEIRIN